MTRERLHLTDIGIRALPIPNIGQKTHFEREGFGVRVSQGGTKTFVQMIGKERKLHTIGRVGQISLKDARQKAKAIQVAPPEKKRPQSTTEAVAAFLKDAEDRCRPATVSNYRLYLNRLDQQRLEDVTKADVSYTAHALMAAKVFFNWCIREGLTTHNPVQYDKVQLGKRSRVLSDDELKAIWHYEHRPFSDHMKLLILTGQRRNQFNQAQIRGATIFFPAEAMKGKDDHTIPLLPMAKAVMERLTPWSGWSKSKTRLDKAVPIPPWVIHDLRRTFSTNMARLRVPLHITERILAHRSGQVSGVAAIYNRHDFLEESREALAKYEDWLTTIVA
ncbi:tyrosine-type recombinase/integrase [Tsuneonella sp. HG222]